MIISKTPLRISFFGGGTDYPKWYLKYGGQVLSTSIDKYIYITCRYLPPFHEHKLRLVYSKIEKVKNSNELIHPSAKEVINFLKIKDGLEIHYDGDLPARSGIGSSSAFTVGLLSALYAYKGKMISKKQLALESIKIEQDIIKETVGSQDQVGTAFGGLNHIKFSRTGDISVNPIIISNDRLKKLENNIMLFYTGTVRTAEKIAKSVVNNFAIKKNYLERIHNMVDESINILKKGDLNDFGRLLNESWYLKKKLSNRVTNKNIDEIYKIAKKAGALGGKVTGAGGGGFIMFYIQNKNQPLLKKKLSKLLHVPFKFEKNGNQIIYYNKL